MKLETINIKGKEYVPVNERLKYFRKKYPLFSLNTEVIEKTENSILIKATISDESERIVSSGIAEEFKNSTFINKTSYVENCETSACGRALANFGIGLDTSVSSAEEVTNAINNQSKTKYDVIIGMYHDQVLSPFKTLYNFPYTIKFCFNVSFFGNSI